MPTATSASDSLATNGAIQICIVLYCIVHFPKFWMGFSFEWYYQYAYNIWSS